MFKFKNRNKKFPFLGFLCVSFMYNLFLLQEHLFIVEKSYRKNFLKFEIGKK